MNSLSIAKLIGAIALLIGLAGCIDVTMDIEVLSDTTARATVTSVMGPDIYPMVKAGMASEGQGNTEGNAQGNTEGDAQGNTQPEAEASANGFCDKEGEVLTETPDGGATCVQVTEGPFADLLKDNSENGATFTVVSPGVVRVAMKTADMQSDVTSSAGGEEEMDEQTKAMMAAFFTGKNLTLRFRGKEVLESNMTISPDKTAAEKVIPMLDLINGTADLPDELYAVVRIN